MANRRNFIQHLGLMAGAFSANSLFNQAHAAEFADVNLKKKMLSPKEIAMDEDYWSVIQQGYTVSPSLINLNNGGVSPSPKIVQEAVEGFNKMTNEGPSFFMWRILDQGREPLRYKLAQLAGCDPEEIAITPVSSTANTINQLLYKVDKDNKLWLLIDLIKTHNMETVLVFTRTKFGADKVVKKLDKYKIKSEAIHGNKSQNARQRALNNFKDGTTTVLVATDIAARGIDVDQLQHVINFEIPNEPETYVHRIGRTGRALNLGKAITFCNEAEQHFIHKIEKLIRQQIPVLNIPEKVFIEETSYEERQAIAKQIDEQKRKDDPDFKGAFHEKKTLTQRNKFKAARAKAGGEKMSAAKKKKYK